MNYNEGSHAVNSLFSILCACTVHLPAFINTLDNIMSEQVFNQNFKVCMVDPVVQL